MGYSISVELPDRQARDRMVEFLSQQDWQTLANAGAGRKGGDKNAEPLVVVQGDGLAYPAARDRERLLGFNGSLIPHAAWAVIAWVAVQHTKPGREPHFWHDTERMPCVINDDPNFETRHFQVDTRGVFVIKPDKSLFLGKLANLLSGKETALENEREWMIKLNERWRIFQKPASHRTAERKITP